MQEQLKRGRIEHQQDFESRVNLRLAKIREADPTATLTQSGEDAAIATIRGDNHWPMEAQGYAYCSNFVPGTARFKADSQDRIRVLGHTFRKMRSEDYLGYDGIERGSFMCEIESPNGPDDPNGYTTLFLLPDGSIYEQEVAERPGYLEGFYTRHWKFDDRWASPMPESQLFAGRVLMLMPLGEGNVARTTVTVTGAPANVLEEIFNLDLDEPCWVQEGFACPLGETTVDAFGRPLCFVPASKLLPRLATAGEDFAPVVRFVSELLDRPVVLYWAQSSSRGQECKTDIEVQLTGRDGNAFSIMGAVTNALSKAGRRDLIEAFKTEAMGGDYDNLLTTCMRYVQVR